MKIYHLNAGIRTLIMLRTNAFLTTVDKPLYIHDVRRIKLCRTSACLATSLFVVLFQGITGHANVKSRITMPGHWPNTVHAHFCR